MRRFFGLLIWRPHLVGSSSSYPLAEPLDENRFGLTAARDATMSAGMLAAERSFHRLKGHRDMPALVAGLARPPSR
jgi:hypothetical protein